MPLPIRSHPSIGLHALEGCDVYTTLGGTSLSYDVAGYDRVVRRETPAGSFAVRDCPPAAAAIPRLWRNSIRSGSLPRANFGLQARKQFRAR